YPLDPRETIVLITIGAAISNINIVRSGVSLFTRDVTIGGNAFTEEIQKQLGIAADEAEAYKTGGHQTEDGVVPQEVLRVMDGVSEVMAGEFQRSLDFFLATTADANVTRIVLAGGSSKVGSLHRAIERRSRLPLEVADAWRRVEIDSSLDRAYLGAHSPECLIGGGLAMRSAGDKRHAQDQPVAAAPGQARRRPRRVGAAAVDRHRRAGRRRRGRGGAGRPAPARPAHRAPRGQHPAPGR